MNPKKETSDRLWTVNFGSRTIKAIIKHYLNELRCDDRFGKKMSYAKIVRYCIEYVIININDFIEFVNRKQK